MTIYHTHPEFTMITKQKNGQKIYKSEIHDDSDRTIAHAIGKTEEEAISIAAFIADLINKWHSEHQTQ